MLLINWLVNIYKELRMVSFTGETLRTLMMRSRSENARNFPLIVIHDPLESFKARCSDYIKNWGDGSKN